jgi:hypothetical protein
MKINIESQSEREVKLNICVNICEVYRRRISFFMCKPLTLSLFTFSSSQEPAGIFELIEVVGNGTYGQVYKVNWIISDLIISDIAQYRALSFSLYETFREDTQRLDS